mmetsp:Transcript_20880/g.40943  ORF Transcript_20880/g.40943 Transcript_20880/m.40943 type:complete len:92 (-) Transcript_20880:1480-1755(-)
MKIFPVVLQQPFWLQIVPCSPRGKLYYHFEKQGIYIESLDLAQKVQMEPSVLVGTLLDLRKSKDLSPLSMACIPGVRLEARACHLEKPFLE